METIDRRMLRPIQNPNVLPDPRLLENAQLDPTNGMSDPQLMLSGAGKFVVDKGRGLRQAAVETMAPRNAASPDVLGFGKRAQELRGEEDERARLDKPLMSTPQGKAGYTAAALASMLGVGRLLPQTAMAAPARQALVPDNLAGAAYSGAVQGATEPLGTNESRAGHAAQGGLIGAGANIVAQVPGRLAQPVQNLSPHTNTLIREGVVPTPGQAVDRRTVMGRFASGVEEKLQSLPLIGDIIAHARQRAVNDLNSAAMRRAGGTGATGYQAIDDAHTALNQEFTRLTQGQSVRLDHTFNVNLRGLTLTNDARRAISDKLNDLFAATNHNNELTGQAYGKFRSELSAAGSNYIHAPAPADRDLGFAFRRMADSLDNAFEAQAAPDVVHAWQTARDQWGNLKRVEGALARNTGNEQTFTATQLKREIMHQAQSDSQMSRGRARMTDLADAGMQLTGKIPNSGTFDRAAIGGLVGLSAGGAGAHLGGVLPEAMAGYGGLAAGAGALYGARPITRYLVGGYPGQQRLSSALQSLEPIATQAGIADPDDVSALYRRGVPGRR